MKGDSNFVSGYGILIQATVLDEEIIVNTIMSQNQRANQIWERAIDTEQAIRYLDYKGKQDYLSEVWNEVVNIVYEASPYQMFFSKNFEEMAKNLVKYSQKGPICIKLNEYDLVPSNFEEFNDEQKLLFIITTKYVATIALDRLSDIHRRYSLSGYNENTYHLNCSLSDEQLSYLLRILKRLKFVSADTDSWNFIDFFGSECRFNVLPFRWLAGTQIMLFLFHRMFLEKYILNRKWHIVLGSRNVITKYGNKLTISNSKATLHNITLGKGKIKDKKKVDNILKKLKFFGDNYASKH